VIPRGLATGSLGCLLGLLLGAGAWAGEVDTPTAEAPADQPFSLQQALKLPDWLRVSISYTAEPMANPIGGAAQTSAWIQDTALDLQVGAGLGKAATDWVELDHWSLNLNVNTSQSITATPAGLAPSSPHKPWPTPPGSTPRNFRWSVTPGPVGSGYALVSSRSIAISMGP